MAPGGKAGTAGGSGFADAAGSVAGAGGAVGAGSGGAAACCPFSEVEAGGAAGLVGGTTALLSNSARHSPSTDAGSRRNCSYSSAT